MYLSIINRGNASQMIEIACAMYVYDNMNRDRIYSTDTVISSYS